MFWCVVITALNKTSKKVTKIVVFERLPQTQKSREPEDKDFFFFFFTQSNKGKMFKNFQTFYFLNSMP